MPPLPSDMYELAVASMQYVYKEKFEAAQNTTKKIIKNYPDHPAGYFFYASVLDAHMSIYNNDRNENEFYQYCDLAIAKGESILQKDPADPWARFFVAGANGAKGTYESRMGRWITAFRHGWQGVAIFKEMASMYPGFSDLLYGIGTYDYWRSAMTKTLWWMPGVKDKREEAIEMLYTAFNKGMLVGDAAAGSLISILCNEKRYNEALEIAERMLKKYPTSTIFKLGKGQAEVGLNMFSRAEKTFTSILTHLQENGVLTPYNHVLVRYYLAKSYAGQQQKDKCLKQCKIIAGLKIKKEERDQLEGKLDEISSIYKQMQ